MSVGFYFTETPPTRVPALLRMTRQDLDIPAGNNLHVVTSTYRLPVDLDLFTVQPHAHNLAREIEGFARLADGTTRPLLYVKDWDFNWQGVYRYVEAGVPARRHDGGGPLDLRQFERTTRGIPTGRRKR